MKKVTTLLFIYIHFARNILLVSGNLEDDFTYTQHCSGPSSWIVQTKKVCYGPEVSEEATFHINGNKTIVAIRLIHLSGDLTCKKVASNWGCQQDTCAEDSCHGTRIRRNRTNQVFPDNHMTDGDQLYTFPGFNIDDDLLIIKFQGWPTQVYDGEAFSVYYEGYRGTGIHCVRAEASFLL